MAGSVDAAGIRDGMGPAGAQERRGDVSLSRKRVIQVVSSRWTEGCSQGSAELWRIHFSFSLRTETWPLFGGRRTLHLNKSEPVRRALHIDSVLQCSFLFWKSSS